MLTHSEQLIYTEAAAYLGMGPGPGLHNAAAGWHGTAQKPPAETSSDRGLQPLLNGALGPAACRHHTKPLFMMQLLKCSQSQTMTPRSVCCSGAVTCRTLQNMMPRSVRFSVAVTCRTFAEHDAKVCSL